MTNLVQNILQLSKFHFPNCANFANVERIEMLRLKTYTEIQNDYNHLKQEAEIPPYLQAKINLYYDCKKAWLQEIANNINELSSFTIIDKA